MIKKIRRIKIISLIMVLASGVTANQSWASSSVLFIFDVSNRMSGKFPEHTRLKDLNKIKIEANLFQATLRDLPKDLNVGVEAYGHYGDKDCSAIEIMQPVLPLDTEMIMTHVDKFTPDQGSTPLSKALIRGSEAFNKEQESKDIVLFTSHSDTCGGDIDAAVNLLKQQNITLHVLGIDVKNEEMNSLTHIAKTSDGQYYAIANNEDMEQSLESIKQDLIHKTHERYEEKTNDKSLETGVFFREDFNKGTLSEKWRFLNVDKSKMSLGEGFLTLLTSSEKAANILQLDMPGVEKDWFITANFNLVPQAIDQVFELGLSNTNDPQEIFSQLNVNGKGDVTLQNIKNTSKSKSNFRGKLFSHKVKSLNQYADFFKEHIKSITIKLHKVGLKYEALAKLEPAKENNSTIPSDWIVLPGFSAAGLVSDTFFIRTYLKKGTRFQSNNVEGKTILNWVEVKIMNPKAE